MIAAIEDRVDGILAGVPSFVWDCESLPVPVEDIVDSVFGLRVRVVDDMSAAIAGTDSGRPVPGHLSGLLLTGPGEIWVNAEEARKWPGRRRFTISHELGHWVLHRSGQEAVFCRAGVIDPDPEPGPAAEPVPVEAIPPAEAEADVFAASMLMPADLVASQYEQTGGDITVMKEAFHSSEKAMVRRIRDVVPQDRWRTTL